MGWYDGLLLMKALLVLTGSMLVLSAAAAVEPVVQRRRVPAMYVFGDSTLDVGNNNHLQGKQVPRADKPYYGIDLPGSGKPTGRFSNGYNVADFVGNYIYHLYIMNVLAYLICIISNL